MIPYRSLQRCGTILVAARGPQLDTFNLQDGSYLSSWKGALPPKRDVEARAHGKSQPDLPEEKSEPDGVEDESGPAAKRRKLRNDEDGAQVDDATKEETQFTNGKGKQKSSRGRQESIMVPNVVLLASTTDSRHVVAVTGEDKTVRVFKLSQESGVLEQRSERIMPKRPCAIAITRDNSTIVCGDKFGDVYSLPLIPTPPEPDPEPTKPPTTPEGTAAANAFVPAANRFTVHSQRNLKALENQKKHGTSAHEKKAEPKFEHSLLLGHVSMLTDLALASVEGRTYILTADRDEHIRVSRGMPQAHVIEGYCLGHTDFIGRICAPGRGAARALLISGGGGDELFAWDFLAGAVLQKADVKTPLHDVMSSLPCHDAKAEPLKVTVSGIHHIHASDDARHLTFAVTCEGVPALFLYAWTAEPQSFAFLQALTLAGNPLDVASLGAASFVVSVDTYFEAGSTDRVRAGPGPEALQCFGLEAGNGRAVRCAREPRSFDTARACAEASRGEHVVAKEAMTNLLYNFQNLRKQEKDEEGGWGG